MLVSAMEKKPDITSSSTSAASSQKTGISSKSATPENHFQHEAAADVSEQQHHEPAQRPAQRDAPAPAVEGAADDQERERRPGNHGEQRLVVEAQRAAEHRLREYDAARQRQREQREGRRDHAEKQPLQGEQPRTRG